MRSAIGLLCTVLLWNCGGHSVAQPRPDEGTPPPMPARIDAQVHVPGADGRHVTASLRNWTVVGCVNRGSAAPCEETTRIEVPTAERDAMIRFWTESQQPIRCEPEAHGPGDHEFEVRYNGQTHRGWLPAREADLAARNAGPCRAHARMAMWIARQLLH